MLDCRKGNSRDKQGIILEGGILWNCMEKYELLPASKFGNNANLGRVFFDTCDNVLLFVFFMH